MIDASEHLYNDDPQAGHPDVRTRLAGVAYYFVGNGSMQAAVQVAPCGEGSPYGLLIQDPVRLTAKRDVLTFDPLTGLEETMVTLREAGGAEHRAAGVVASWSHAEGIPAVAVEWEAPGFAVSERFSCPETEPALTRRVAVTNRGATRAEIELRTGARGSDMRAALSLAPGETGACCLRYRVSEAGSDLPRGYVVHIERAADVPPSAAVLAYAGEQAVVETGNRLLDHLYRTAADQLSATISSEGRVDAAIWQYTREWVRDHTLMALGLLLAGHHAHAGRMLRRLLLDFIADTGSASDSSEQRAPEEAELDQNGLLLLGIHEHVLWSGDDSLVRGHWERIVRLAEFPLLPVFRHPESGLMANRRDYWERHALHGLEPGLELAHQLFVVLGLRAAAALSRRVGDEVHEARWRAEAARLEHAMLHDPQFSLVESGRFIKRRGLDGRVQEEVHPTPGSFLPDGVGLAANVRHLLNPDSVTALPVAWGLLDPRSPIAHASLADVEGLWNQRWEDGGYARYHVDSEADSAGAWPFVGGYVARAYLEMGRDADVWRILEWLGSAAGSPSGAWFEMNGARMSPPYAQVGIVPWAWAELVLLLVWHLVGVRPQDEALCLRPRPLAGLEHVSARVPVRGVVLTLDVRRTPGARTLGIRGDVTVRESGPDAIIVEYPRKDVRIELLVPEAR